MKIATAASRWMLLALAGLLCTGACAHAATITEFSNGISIGSTPQEIAAGPDGNLWFTERDADQIGRITPAGTVTEFFDGISFESGPYGITAGPDGNMWFTEPDAGQIARISPSGVIDEFSTGITPGSSPQAIVAGPDGNLWYTDASAGRVGRITPTGTVTEFIVNSDVRAFTIEIRVGSDGNLWFTEFPGSIGRMTPAGVFTRFASYGDASIATGPDGNLWTTQFFGMVQRMTPAGVITGAFAVPNRNVPHGIATGPDGNLWIAHGYPLIGRMTTSGQFLSVTTGLAPDANPSSIVAGPDGNMWFTEPNIDQIGRITTAVQPVVTVVDATSIATTSATLHGTVDARSVSTSVRFEYGPTGAYGATSGGQTIAAASEQPISAGLTGLEPATTYHYRVVADSAGGSAQSPDHTFTTPAPPAPPPPAVAAACSNGLDDDRDGFADKADPRCHSDANARRAGTYQPQGSTESPVDDPVLVCSAKGLALVSAELTSRHRRIRLQGVADPGQAGKQVGLYAAARRLGAARVQPDGSFAATFNTRSRAPGRVHYQARLGAVRSASVVPQRRFAGIRMTMAGGNVKLSGRVVGRRPRTVELRGRARGCGPFKRLATTRVKAGGRFTLSVAAFTSVDIAAYRVQIGAAGAAGPLEATPPRALGLR